MTTNAPRGSRADVDLSWMTKAGCVQSADLPWTADPEHTTAHEVLLMRAVCHGCPVAADCAGYAKQKKVTAGFWAGRHRDRDPASVVAGPRWATDPLPGFGGLGGAA
jgi:Transcription factor WhiB